MTETRRIYGERDDLVLCESNEQALDGADVLSICTEWSEFRSPDFDTIRGKLKAPVIFDGRNLYEPEFVTGQGITYYAIGRGERLPV